MTQIAIETMPSWRAPSNLASIMASCVWGAVAAFLMTLTVLAEPSKYVVIWFGYVIGSGAIIRCGQETRSPLKLVLASIPSPVAAAAFLVAMFYVFGFLPFSGKTYDASNIMSGLPRLLGAGLGSLISVPICTIAWPTIFGWLSFFASDENRAKVDKIILWIGKVVVPLVTSFIALGLR